jgi:hypothetical protein
MEKTHIKMFDWNTLSLEQMINYLEKQFMYSNSTEAIYIINLINYYRNKPIDANVNLNEAVIYLNNKYRFLSSGTAKCIYHLLETFYNK